MHLLLLLLLCVVALGHMTGAAITPGQFNFTECPITVYGKEHTGIYVSEYEDSLFFCFELYKDANPNDCLRTERDSVGSVSVSVDTQDSVNNTSSEYPSHLGVQGTSSCSVRFQILDINNTSMFSLVLRRYGGTYGVLTVKEDVPQTREVYLEISPETNTVDFINVTSGEVSLSLSGCRGQGVALKRDSKSCFPDGSVAVCSATNVLSKEHCKLCENGQCLLEPWCSVTGSSITDISETVTSIRDCCGYILLSRDGLELGAVFKDRRRKDVSLLDHLILTVGSTEIQIGPGGVKLNGSVVNISTTQMPEGITISKTSTEVFLLYDQKFDLCFDGLSALVFFKGLDPSNLEGLCVDAAMNMSSAKSSKLSKDGCDTPHQDVLDNTIDCQTATQHCNLLNGSLFSSCHAHIDPAPFISACTELLCSYPAVDGVQCSFHQTYASLCLKANVTLPDWKTQAQCVGFQGLCLDTYCSDHEFCGVDLNKETCLCRAVFASKYRANKTMGEPTVCADNSATLALVGCLLTEKGIKYSDLHLNDPSCKGHMDPETHMLEFGFDNTDSCGTEVTTENSQIIFKNSVRMKNQTGMITRQDQFTVDFSCFYSQPEVKTVALRIKDSSVVQRIVSGAWSYNLTMKSYLDGTRTSPITPNTELQLDQTIWVQLSTAGLDHKLVSLVTDSCWATSQPQPESSPKYDLIENGCPNPRDKSVKVVGNGLGTSNFFSFNLFQFTGASDVYLHCKVILCSNRSNTCSPVCGSGARRRRSLYNDPSPALITLSWAN